MTNASKNTHQNQGFRSLCSISIGQCSKLHYFAAKFSCTCDLRSPKVTLESYSSRLYRSVRKQNASISIKFSFIAHFVVIIIRTVHVSFMYSTVYVLFVVQSAEVLAIYLVFSNPYRPRNSWKCYTLLLSLRVPPIQL